MRGVVGFVGKRLAGLGAADPRGAARRTAASREWSFASVAAVPSAFADPDGVERHRRLPRVLTAFQSTAAGGLLQPAHPAGSDPAVQVAVRPSEAPAVDPVDVVRIDFQQVVPAAAVGIETGLGDFGVDVPTSVGVLPRVVREADTGSYGKLRLAAGSGWRAHGKRG